MAQLSNSQNPAGPKPGRGCCNLESCLPPAFFKALSDPTRVTILARLARLCRPATVGEIAGCCPTDLSVVSRHLAILREAGILESEKRGREVYHRVRYSEMAGVLRGIAGAIEACCPDDI